MERLKENWKKLLWYEKVVYVFGITCSITVVILALLQLFNIWDGAENIYIPMLAVLMLIQAFEQRKRSRVVMYLSLGVAVFISILSILVLFGV